MKNQTIKENVDGYNTACAGYLKKIANETFPLADKPWNDDKKISGHDEGGFRQACIESGILLTKSIEDAVAMKKNPFKVGDRVRVYTERQTFDSTVSNIMGLVVCIDDRTGIYYHFKQCRLLKKKEMRRIWIRYNFPEISDASNVIIYNTKPPHDGFIEFLEVKKK